MKNEAHERARKRMQMVLTLRYIHGLTLEEVGDRLGCTRERARQIEDMAKRVIRSKPELREKVLDLLQQLDESRGLPSGIYL